MGRTASLVVATETGGVCNFEVDSAESIENIKALIEVETGILLAEQVLTHNGRELLNNKSVADYNIGNDDMLYVQRRVQPQQQQPRQQQQQQQQQGGRLQAAAAPPQQLTPELFLDQIKNNPDLLQQILTNNPVLGEAVLAGDTNTIRRFLEAHAAQNRQQQEENARRSRIAAMDPFSLEYQKAIEEEITQNNVNENMETAMEHTPEAFGRVVMLYIDCKANNVPVKAFVDTGAQQTIMSVKCAERCGIMRLVDRRFSGVAKGVGTARILGRVHMAPIQIDNSFFPCSFTILEDQDMEFILGLDMLRRHQCTIDLNNNVLVIGSERAAFLAEKDIPANFMKESNDDLIPPPTSTSPPPSSTTSTFVPPPQSTTSTTSTSTSTPIPTTASPSPVSTSPPTRTAPPAAQQFSEVDVQQLVSIGATREEAVRLLQQYRGNLELAASHFFGGGF